MHVEAVMKQLPLIVNFRETVFGKRFIAEIRVDGRVLVEVDDGQYWAFGVHPGGLADHGDTLLLALHNFRQRFKMVIIDIATEAGNFQVFKEEVDRFFNECDIETEKDWEAARLAVREGKAHLPGVEKETSERQPSLIVVEMKHALPDYNVSPIEVEEPALAA